jgi:hypothetical protein
MKTPLLVAVIFICTASHAQFKEPKFGKITAEELAMNQYDKDTTADAVVLFDNGNVQFTLSRERTFQFTYERHYRIKILKKAAFNLAETSIKLYKGNGYKEVLNSIKASTYNLVDGKMVTTKLDKDAIFNEGTKYWDKKKFAFPEVKEGSIIELSYSFTSDYIYNLRGWEFQKHYPIVWSQYQVIIPEYFSYRQSAKGYLPFEISTQEKGQATYTLYYESQIEPGMQGGRTPSESYDIKAQTTQYLFATKDVPAFKDEPNIDCEDNYIQSIEFELSSVQYPNSLRKNYTQSWESVNKMMIEHEDFGKLFSSNGFIDDTVQMLCKGLTTKQEKAVAIYNYVQKHIKWNEKFELFAERGLKKPYQERSGSSGEINLLLTLMLKTAGLSADPVMFSTRENGIAISYYPTISKYNSVLSKIDIDGTTYLLDATSDLCPFGVLPSRDINGQGRVVNTSNGDWVDLNAKEKYADVQSAALTIQPDGKITGSIMDRYTGYAAINQRNSLIYAKSEEDYIRNMQENLPGLVVNGFAFANKSDIYSPLSDSLNVEITDKVEMLGNKILFRPLLFETIEKNPYTLEQRNYPVNYNYPLSKTVVTEYTIPEGFAIESVPENINAKMPDGSVSLMYNIQVLNNKIKVIYKMNVNKVLFLPDEYQALKTFYDLIVKKHTEQIILKKA